MPDRTAGFFILAVILTASSASAKSVGDACRHAFSAGERAVSQSETSLGRSRALVACLGEKDGAEFISIVDANGLKSRTVIPSRPFFRGEVVSSQTMVSAPGEDGDENVLVPAPVYRDENPVRADKALLRAGLFSVRSYYEEESDMVPTETWVTQFFRIGEKGVRLVGAFDEYSGGEGGDDWRGSISVKLDGASPVVEQRRVNSDSVRETIQIVEYRLQEGEFAAVSTRTCVNIVGKDVVPGQTALVTMKGPLCGDTDGKHCRPNSGPVRLLDQTSGNDSQGKESSVFEVEGKDGARGFAAASTVTIDCPSSPDSAQ